jgi:hypothetical protein
MQYHHSSLSLFRERFERLVSDARSQPLQPNTIRLASGIGRRLARARTNRLKDLGLNKGLERVRTGLEQLPALREKLIAVYHKADEAIQNVIDLLAA